jgi:hypothetical protein
MVALLIHRNPGPARQGRHTEDGFLRSERKVKNSLVAQYEVQL